MNYILIFCFIIIIFYLVNFFISKSYENFEKLPNGLLCGTDKDECNINQYKKSSCCNGYKCILPKGKYQEKICIKSLNYKYNNENSEEEDDEYDEYDEYEYGYHKPNIPPPQYDILDKISSIPIFTKDYWDNLFSCKNKKIDN